MKCTAVMAGPFGNESEAEFEASARRQPRHGHLHSIQFAFNATHKEAVRKEATRKGGDAQEGDMQGGDTHEGGPQGGDARKLKVTQKTSIACATTTRVTIYSQFQMFPQPNDQDADYPVDYFDGAFPEDLEDNSNADFPLTLFSEQSWSDVEERTTPKKPPPPPPSESAQRRHHLGGKPRGGICCSCVCKHCAPLFFLFAPLVNMAIDKWKIFVSLLPHCVHFSFT